MARFEVFIPPAGPEGVGLTLRVVADSWMAALKIGLHKIGDGNAPTNVFCDAMADESIHVTDPRTGRVFRIAEIVETSDPGGLAPAVPMPPVGALPAVRVLARDVHLEEKPGPIGRGPEPMPDTSVEDALIDLFDRAASVFEKPRDEALYFLLDLAMEKIPADAGTVYVADLNRRDLHFAAARGPKAREVLALEVAVPMGVGFAGFCAQEGVGIAVSDAQRDPRHFKEVSERLGYPIDSVIATPVLSQGRALGVIQLLNKRGSSSFTSAELAILHYVAHQAAVYLASRGA
jgi:hypothetical protein